MTEASISPMKTETVLHAGESGFERDFTHAAHAQINEGAGRM
jgi:hypothetical protein